jgi:hypothetical protein
MFDVLVKSARGGDEQDADDEQDGDNDCDDDHDVHKVMTPVSQTIPRSSAGSIHRSAICLCQRNARITIVEIRDWESSIPSIKKLAAKKFLSRFTPTIANF